METVLFFYNILIMIAFTFCCIDFFLLYYKHKDKAQLCMAVVFFLFIFDNLLLYMYEFLPGFTEGFAMHGQRYAFAANLLSYFIILAYRLTVIALEQKRMTALEALPWGLLLIMVLSATGLFPDKPAQILVNVLLGVPSIAVFLLPLIRNKKIGGFPTRGFVPTVGPFFLWSSVLFEVFSCIEGILSRVGVYLLRPDRQLSIELLSIFYSVAAIWFLLKSQLAEEKPAARPVVASEDESGLLTRFADVYGLTQRDRDILAFLVQGCSNADICKGACISEGTVKTHTHNIYQKLDVKNRVQLGVRIKEFQKTVPSR